MVDYFFTIFDTFKMYITKETIFNLFKLHIWLELVFCAYFSVSKYDTVFRVLKLNIHDIPDKADVLQHQHFHYMVASGLQRLTRKLNK